MLRHYPKITTDGLILCLDAANVLSYPGSGTSWLDLSSNNLNASSVQSPTFSSNNGGFFTFDGGSITATGQVDSFSISDNSLLDTLSAISIEMWIYINTIQGSGSANMLFSKRGLNTNGYVGFFTNSSFVFRIGTSSPTQLSWSTTPTTGVWQQIIITVGSSGGKIYKNGVEVVNSGSYTGSFGNIDTSASLLIGDVNPNNSGLYGFNGRFSIFKIYNKILSSTDILNNYYAIKGRYGL